MAETPSDLRVPARSDETAVRGDMNSLVTTLRFETGDTNVVVGRTGGGKIGRPPIPCSIADRTFASLEASGSLAGADVVVDAPGTRAAMVRMKRQRRSGRSEAGFIGCPRRRRSTRTAERRLQRR